MKSRSITQDFKNNWLFLSILFVGCIPQIFFGYSMYLLVLLIPIILFQYNVRFNDGLMLTILFSLAYTVPLLFHKDVPNAAILIFTLIYPPLFYLIPRYLFSRFNNPVSILIVTIMLTLCIALWSIMVNIQDTAISGSVVNITRSLKYSMPGFEGENSATAHNMMLSLAIGGIGMLFVKIRNQFDKKIKIFLIIFGFLSLFAAIHLLNRTALFLAVFACMVPVALAGSSIKRTAWIFAIMGILVIVYLFFIQDSIWFGDISEGFLWRNSVGGSLESGNDRDIRWLAAINQMPSYPWGTDELIMNGKLAYAHNLWLDCGIQAGWIAFIILIFITYKFIKSAYKCVIKYKTVPFFWRNYLAIIAVVLLLQSAVEPVIQGVFVLFLMMFYLWSLFGVLNSKKYILKLQFHHYRRIRFAKMKDRKRV